MQLNLSKLAVAAFSLSLLSALLAASAGFGHRIGWWPFGFGLSYSKFEYSGLQVQRTADGARVSVRVKNASGPDGDEVVQLYVSGPAGPENPLRELRGFRRIHLPAGPLPLAHEVSTLA